MPILLFVLEVLEMGTFGDEEFDHFCETITTCPDNRIPFLLRILYKISQKTYIEN